jgi:hypothetical protein
MSPEEMEELNKLWAAVTQTAAKACDKASSPYVAPEDRGIHTDPVLKMCDELLAGGWRSVELHNRGLQWVSPHDGLKYPGPGYAHSLMLKERGTNGQRNEKI